MVSAVLFVVIMLETQSKEYVILGIDQEGRVTKTGKTLDSSKLTKELSSLKAGISTLVLDSHPETRLEQVLPVLQKAHQEAKLMKILLRAGEGREFLVRFRTAGEIKGGNAGPVDRLVRA